MTWQKALNSGKHPQQYKKFLWLSLIQTAILNPTESVSRAADKLFAQFMGGSIPIVSVKQVHCIFL